MAGFTPQWLALGLGAVATLAIAQLVGNRKLSKSVMLWPSVVGEISKSKLQKSYDEGRERFGVSVEYRFVANGKSVTSSKIAIIEPSFGGDPESAQDWLDLHRVGEEVTVYFNPVSPWQCYIDRSYHLKDETVVALVAVMFTM